MKNDTENHILHVLVGDLDYTVSTYQQHRPDYLSPAVLEMVKKHHYDEFYACTHRCQYTLWFPPYNYAFSHMMQNFTFASIHDFLTAGDTWKKFSTYSKTTAIIENFTHATGLQCIHVSCDDDALYDSAEQCGHVYRHIIEPFEKNGQNSSSSIPLTLQYTWHLLTGFGNTKNPQLVQIARDLACRHPGKKISIDFIDDKEKLCAEALNIKSTPDWPAQIDIRVFHHHPDTLIIREIAASIPREENRTAANSVLKFGLFAGAVVAGGVGILYAAGEYPAPPSVKL